MELIEEGTFVKVTLDRRAKMHVESICPNIYRRMKAKPDIRGGVVGCFLLLSEEILRQQVEWKKE